MYEKYMLLLEEEAKIRNLKNRSVLCYKNYVSCFLNYVAKTRRSFPARMSGTSFLQRRKKDSRPPHSTFTIQPSVSFTGTSCISSGMMSGCPACASAISSLRRNGWIFVGKMSWKPLTSMSYLLSRLN